MKGTELAEAQYLSLRTFRRDGTAVDTAVWAAGLERSLVVFTDGTSWKVKRIRRNPACAVAVCDAFGNVTGGWTSGEARIVDDAAREQAAYASLHAKYGVRMKVADLGSWIAGRIGRRKIIEITLTEDG